MKRPAVLGLLGLAVLLAGGVLWACGPFLPNLILDTDDQILRGFNGIFNAEMDRLRPSETAGAPSFKALPPPDEDPDAQTAAADAADLEEALKRLGTPGARREDALRSLSALRARLLEQYSEAPPVPAGLPPEFTLYLEGAIAWREGRSDEAGRSWERLLELPADQRRFRSTWAAFMLGKASLDDEPEEAVRRFRLTRELAAEGFVDSLGLAASSLGWEAMAEMNQGHPEKALVLYQRQREAGDPTAFNSLLATSSRVVGSEMPQPLARIAADPEARAVLTAYIVSWDSSNAENWLKTLEAADVRDEANTDRIAWAAYLAGDFEQAAAWLERAPESSPITRWLRARLLLRDGRLDEARELLAGVARDLPQTGMSLDKAFWFASESSEILAAPQRAAGEEAVIRLTRNDFAGALDELLRAGYWMDAAYLAEQVLTADELKAYVDAAWPAELAARHHPPESEWQPHLAGGYTAPPPERLAQDLRYLLGRRLAREGRTREAEAYVPAEPRAALQSFSAHLAAGRDARRPRPARAAELFGAACVLRQDGMEITGTETAPDWTLFGGGYDLGDPREIRSTNFLFPSSPEETARAMKNRAAPWKRFHYRYRAADLAWDAAKLLPSGDTKAEILATAGNWIKYRDPEAADRFYKELVRCCRATDLGREADELRWFPEADACPEQGDAE